MSVDELSLVIPAYNEQGAVVEVVRKCREVLARLVKKFEIIVVDDCSKDETGARAREAGATVIRHAVNAGYGNALKTGIRAAQYAHVAICDADGSYDPADFEKLLREDESIDMVVGARTGNEFLGKGLKRVARWWQLHLVRFTVGSRIPDANSGMRVFKRTALDHFLWDLCGGFSFTTSVSVAMHSTGCLVKYVPIGYYPRTGASHVRIVRDTLRSLQILVEAIVRYNPLKGFITLTIPVAALALIALALAALAVCLQQPGLAVLLGLVFILGFIASFLLLGMGMLACAVQRRNR